jgi:carbonic anhydrase
MRTFNKELQQSLTPAQALEILKEGNQRFVNNSREGRDLLQQVQATKDGQWPFAVILSCLDSRTSSELVFDLGIGDAFNARIAGNIVNEDILGSMEFACKVAGAKLIAVIGHTKCGAVKGACDHVQLGNLTSLISKLEPAVAEEKSITDNRSSSNAEFVEKVSEINVRRNIQEILNRSSILKEMVDNGEIGIVGGMHDITTGVVDFYDDATIIKESKQLSSQQA